MSKKLFVAGKDGKGAKPTNWLGVVLIILPIVGVFSFTILHKNTGQDIYNQLSALSGLLAVLLAIYMLKSDKK
jgi:hypothetical protein